MNLRRYFYAAWYGALDGINRERVHINLESTLAEQARNVPPIRPARTAQEVRQYNEWTPERNSPWNTARGVERRGGRS